MDSGRVRVVKLSGLPEVLRRGVGSARIIDATSKPQTNGVRQRTRQSIVASPQPQIRPRPQSHPLGPTQSTARTSTLTQTANSLPHQYHHPQPPLNHNHHNDLQNYQQQLYNHNYQQQYQQSADYYRSISRNCTPNILHPQKGASPPQQLHQRRATSLSPAPQTIYNPQLDEKFERLESGLNKISKHLEQFCKIYLERSTTSTATPVSTVISDQTTTAKPIPHRRNQQPQSINQPLPGQYNPFNQKSNRPANHNSNFHSNFNTRKNQAPASFAPPPAAKSFEPISSTTAGANNHRNNRLIEELEVEEEDPLADVSMASKDYLFKHNLV